MNIMRFLVALIIFSISVVFSKEYYLHLIFASYIAFSVIWFIINYIKPDMEEKEPGVAYIPTVTDLLIFSALFYLNGTFNSIFIIAPLISVVFSSLNITIRQGFIATIIAIICVTVLPLLVYNGILPGENIISSEKGLTLPQLSVSLIGSVTAFVVMHKVIDTLLRQKHDTEEQLKIERDKLKERNELIDKELALARTIQEKILPINKPHINIHSIYHSMDMIGGDFYDYILFNDKNITGIFISDVSGHGVPAALVTSMLKMSLSTGTQYHSDPAALLHHLNSSLYRHTSHNFITAFYCLYNKETRELTYSNAGHNPPYIISSDNIYTLDSKKSIPLAIRSNRFLQENDKSYINHTIVLKEDDKLFLYTDGLTECFYQNECDEMFEDHLEGHLNTHRDLPAGEFLKKIYGSLVNFNGSENFDDDVCLLCLHAN